MEVVENINYGEMCIPAAELDLVRILWRSMTCLVLLV